MFFATNGQPDQEEDQVCGFVYLSFLSLQINFHSKVNFFFSFSFGKTCGYCHLITSSVENENFEKSYNCDHCSLFHHIENRFQVACDIVNHSIVMKYYIFDV
jgi:hypothetical protein